MKIGYVFRFVWPAASASDLRAARRRRTLTDRPRNFRALRQRVRCLPLHEACGGPPWPPQPPPHHLSLSL